MSTTSLAYFAIAAHIGDWNSAGLVALDLPLLTVTEIVGQPLIENALILAIMEAPSEILAILQTRVSGLPTLPSIVGPSAWGDHVLLTLASIHAASACSALAKCNEPSAKKHLLQLIAIPVRKPQIQTLTLTLVDVVTEAASCLEAELGSELLRRTELLFADEAAAAILRESFGNNFEGFRLLGVTLHALAKSDQYREHALQRTGALLCETGWPTLRQLRWIKDTFPGFLAPAVRLPLNPISRAFVATLRDTPTRSHHVAS